MGKREYKKPGLLAPNNAVAVIPAALAAGAAAFASSAIAPGAALVGGYAVGRAVKSAMEVREDIMNLRTLKKVESFA